MLKSIAFLAALTLAGAAFAQAPTCSASAEQKKLSGAAKTSFLKKCETGANAACEAQAIDKKLSGAAKTSFVTKCVKGAVG